MSFSRRRFLGTTALAAASSTVGAAGASFLPAARAQGQPIGTVLDYASGVPSARSIKNAGHLGAVRYVSQRRPGANWMLGKPLGLKETQDFAGNGLFTASVYQFGKDKTADWLSGAAGAAVHAPQAINLHRAAGGPSGKPIYVAIDDNPSRSQYENQVRPYLQAFQAALEAASLQTGVYGNWNTIQWCIQDGIGSYYWQHDWGSAGKLHPRANLHQKAGKVVFIEGVECDVNDVYTQDWGQWQAGQKIVSPSPAQNQNQGDAGPKASDYRLPENSSLPHFSHDFSPQGMSSQAQRYANSLSEQDIQNAVDFARQFIQ